MLMRWRVKLGDLSQCCCYLYNSCCCLKIINVSALAQRLRTMPCLAIHLKSRKYEFQDRKREIFKLFKNLHLSTCPIRDPAFSVQR